MKAIAGSILVLAAAVIMLAYTQVKTHMGGGEMQFFAYVIGFFGLVIVVREVFPEWWKTLNTIPKDKPKDS